MGINRINLSGVYQPRFLFFLAADSCPVETNTKLFVNPREILRELARRRNDDGESHEKLS